MPHHTAISGLFVDEHRMIRGGCYEARDENSAAHSTLRWNEASPLKLCGECAIFRCYTHQRNWTGLLKSSGYDSWTDCVLQEWKLFWFAGRNFYLLQPPRVFLDGRLTRCEFGEEVYWSRVVCDIPFFQPAILVQFLGMVMAMAFLDDSPNSIAYTSDAWLPPVLLFVGPSPATWTYPYAFHQFTCNEKRGKN